MQFYQNGQKHLWEVIIGSKNHNYNKRRRLHNAGRKLDFIGTVLDENKASKAIHKVLVAHHVSHKDLGIYVPRISKHCNQIIYKYHRGIARNEINPQSMDWTQNAFCKRKYQYIVFLEKLQYACIVYRCHQLQHIIKCHVQWCNSLVNRKKQLVIFKEIKSNQKQLTKYITYLRKNMKLCLQHKSFKIMSINTLTSLEYYIISENDNDDGVTNDNIAGLYVNELDDIIDCNIDDILINPMISTIGQFKKYMLKHYHILVQTKSNQGTVLKYWHFILLDSKKHQPNLNIRWISESKGLYPAYTVKNIKKAIHNNSVAYIHEDEQFHFLLGHKPKIYILFGDYGAGQTIIQKNLYKLLNIKPIGQFIYPRHQDVCLIDMNLKSVLNYVHKYPKVVVPIKLVMPSQRTVFHRLLKHSITYQRACSDIRKNKLMYAYGQRIIPQALKFKGNNISEMLYKFTNIYHQWQMC